MGVKLGKKRIDYKKSLTYWSFQWGDAWLQQWLITMSLPEGQWVATIQKPRKCRLKNLHMRSQAMVEYGILQPALCILPMVNVLEV